MRTREYHCLGRFDLCNPTAVQFTVDADVGPFVIGTSPAEVAGYLPQVNPSARYTLNGTSYDVSIEFGDVMSARFETSDQGTQSSVAGQLCCGTQGATQSASVNGRKDHMWCSHGNCKHPGPFQRRWELDRHVRVKHGSRKPFPCPYGSCLKGHEATRFARSDKLTAHIRSVHRIQFSTELRCPVSGCPDRAMPAGLLYLHTVRKHGKLFDSLTGIPRSQREECQRLRAIVNAANPARPNCPIRNCSAMPFLSSLIHHLLRHKNEDLDAAAEDLLVENYILFKNPQQGRSIAIVCPMCRDISWDRGQFEQHFDQAHALAREQVAHFQGWKQALQQFTRAFDDHWSSPWVEWLLRSTTSTMVQCPYCRESYNITKGRRFPNHHFRMLADPLELMPHRQAILKLHRDFASHPIWNDLN